MADFVTRIILQNTQFKTQLQECKKQIKDLKESGGKAGHSISNFNHILNKVGINANSSGSLLGQLGGVLGKLGGAFGVALGAGALFNKMLDNSQTLGDAFEKKQIQAGSAVDYLATCMASADFNGFISGLQKTISEAGTLAEMLDDLATEAQRLGVIDAKAAAKKAAAKNEYYSAKTKEERKAAVEKMRQADEELRQAHSYFGKKNLEAGRQQIKARINPQLNGVKLTNYQIDKYFLNERKAAEIGEQTNKRLKKINAERKKIYDKANQLKKKDDNRNSYVVGYAGKDVKNYVSSDDDKRLKQLLKQENAIKKTLGFAYHRMNELQDNKENSPMTTARRNYSTYYNQQKFVSDQESETARRALRAETFSGVGGSKTGGKKTVGKKAEVTKVFNEAANTIQGMQDNIDILTEKLKKCVPNTNEYKAVEASIDDWKGKLSMVGFDANAKTIKGINDNIQVLSDKLENLDPNTNAFKETTKQLDEWKTKLDDINNNGFNDSATSIKDINNNLQILNYRLEKTTPRTAEWKQVTNQIKQQKKLLNEFSVGSIADLNSQLSELQERLNNENLTLKARIKLETTKKELQNTIDTISDTTSIKVRKLDYSTQDKVSSYDNAQSNIDSIKNQYDLGIIDKETADKQIAEINKQLQEIGLKPIKVHIQTDFEKEFSKFRQNAGDIIGGFEGIDGVVNSIESLSNSLSNGANAWQVFMGAVQTAGSVLQMVADVITAVNTITEILGTTTAATAAADTAATTQQITNAQSKVAANSAEAISGATASGAKIPFPLNLAAIAASIAAVVAGLSMIGSFADGGVIGGNSFHGDKLLANVNSGEMILNNKQQGNLFKILNSGNVATGNSASVVKIKGSDLYVALSNYNSKMGKIR